MNFQCSALKDAIRVLLVNPIFPSGQILAMKLLAGKVLGFDINIDLILFVYPHDFEECEALKQALEACAFDCLNSITIRTDPPKVTDADIFCFLTDFPNPCYIDYQAAYSKDKYLEDKSAMRINDSLFWLLKVTKGLNWADFTEEKTLQLAIMPPLHMSTKSSKSSKPEPIAIKAPKKSEEPIKRTRPIFIADGLATLNIVYTFSKNIPSELFFCPTTLTTLAKSILADHIKVETRLLNNILIWAASDYKFHIEVHKPLVTTQDEQKSGSNLSFQYEGITSDLEHSEFNDTWLKKDYIDRILQYSKKTTHGHISKADGIASTLKKIWRARGCDEKKDSEGNEVFANLGIISDGSIDTIKGYPYVLPIILKKDAWRVNTSYSEEAQFILEMRKINKETQKLRTHHLSFCKAFYEEHVRDKMSPPPHPEPFYVIQK